MQRLVFRVIDSASGVSTAILGNIVKVALQAFAIIFLARVLGANEYGHYVTISSVVIILGTCVEFGGYTSSLRSIALGRDPRSVIRDGLLITIVAGLCGCAIAVALLQKLVPAISILATTGIAVATLLLQPNLRTLQGLNVASGSILLSATIDAMTALASLLSAISAMLFVPSLLGVAAFTVLYSAITLAGATVLTRRNLPPPPDLLAPIQFDAGLRSSVTASAFLQSLTAEFDKTVLAKYLIPFELGTYGLAMRMLGVLATPAIALLTVRQPRLFQVGLKGLDNFRPEAKRLAWETALVTCGSLLAAVVAIALVPIVFGTQFAQSSHWLALAGLILVLQAGHYYFGDMLLVLGRPSHRLIVHIVLAATSLSCNLALIPRWGITGALTASYLANAFALICSFLLTMHLSKHRR